MWFCFGVVSVGFALLVGSFGMLRCARLSWRFVVLYCCVVCFAGYAIYGVCLFNCYLFGVVVVFFLFLGCAAARYWFGGVVTNFMFVGVVVRFLLVFVM